jgi:BirA family transcriptional regulator, biotin operon repressor / biotin---[acetyl-CoA-carboxylase] ligase
MPGVEFTDIRHFGSIDSTNRYLLDQARRGAPEGVVAVADHQSAGRGRLGRRWEAPPGSNLLVSVLLRPDLPVARRHLASVVVALAATDAVQAVTGLEVGIKWPNDLLAPDGGKLAGVLAESDLAPSVGTTGGDPTAIVVGIGINVNWPQPDTVLPPDLAGSATSLWRLAGQPVDRAGLLEALLHALGPRAADLGTEPGRVHQVAEFRSRCATLGTPVRVELAHERFEGVATDVTPEGHLVVAVGHTTRTVVSGDVVHVRPAG